MSERACESVDCVAQAYARMAHALSLKAPDMDYDTGSGGRHLGEADQKSGAALISWPLRRPHCMAPQDS